MTCKARHQAKYPVGTGLRISVPVLNLHKTRLNDPHLSFLGTNDHPGDYRSSGCTACHTIYANDCIHGILALTLSLGTVAAVLPRIPPSPKMSRGTPFATN